MLAQFYYNVDGIRTRKVVDGTAINYLVDANQPYAQVIAETNDNGQAIKTYLYGADLISQSSSGQTHSFHYDGLGSTWLLSDESGNVSDQYSYAAFGELLNATGDTDNNYLFTGEQYDDSVDNYYLRARYYNPEIGRFTRQDEWLGRDGEPVTLNKYLYANSDGANWIDPSGYMGVGFYMSGLRIQSNLATSVTRSFFITGKDGKGKSLTKIVACRVGAAYMKNSVAKDAAKAGSFMIEAHHPFNKSFLPTNSKNRRPRQSLIRLHRETHHMFHQVLDLILAGSSNYDGLRDKSAGKLWVDFLGDNGDARQKLYLDIKASAAIVDSLCDLKRTESLSYYVEKNKHKFL